MTSTHDIRRLAIWAIDPFEVEVKPNLEAVEELKQWADRLGIDIQPAYVLRIKKSDHTGEDTPELWLKQQAPVVAKKMTNYLEEFHISRLREPEVIIENTSSIHKQVDALVRYAQRARAQWIIVSSKGLSGITRMVLGSFAETLLLNSPVPVWVFGHGKCTRTQLEKIMFATDFTDFSKEALEEVIRQAKEAHSEITLYHKVTLPQEPQTAMMASGIPIPPTYIDDYLRDQKKWAEETAERWKKNIESQGVETQYTIETGMGQIPQSILEYANTCGVGIIAMASQSKAASALLLGSNAREVIRNSECPAWIFGPKWLRRS